MNCRVSVPADEYLKIDCSRDAAAYLEHAVTEDPQKSAARKMLGKVRLGANDQYAARAAWTQGVAIAEARGYEQAATEMTLFLGRPDNQ